MLKLSFLNVFFSIFLVPLMMQCEDGRGSVCDSYTQYGVEENLCQLLPAKLNYSQGETVSFKFAIPSKLSLDEKKVDLFKETKLNSGFLFINLSELFKDNMVTLIKGEKMEDNKFKATYNAGTDSYELDINVQLNRTGIYSFESIATFRDRDYQDTDCAFITVTTPIKGANSDDSRTEFVVN